MPERPYTLFLQSPYGSACGDHETSASRHEQTVDAPAKLYGNGGDSNSSRDPRKIVCTVFRACAPCFFYRVSSAPPLR